jgi:hypothetical protein
LKLAAVQLDVVPFGVGPDGTTWIPSEPGTWPVGRDADVVPLRDLNDFPSIKQLRLSTEKRLVNAVHGRLQQLLSFLDESGVDLCVFPEYSLPCDEETLNLLAGFSQRMVIVAGVGVPRQTGVELLTRFIDEPVDPSNNVVLIFAPESRHIVTKMHAAEGEQIVEGSGPRLFNIVTPIGPLKLGVAICKDYIVAGESGAVFGEVPDICAIPALTPASEPFRPGGSRDFPRVFANGAMAGGSNVFASGCTGPFVSKRLPLHLPDGAEGVLAVQWFGALEKPTSVLKKQNSVFLRAAILTQSEGSASAIVADMRGLAESPDTTASIEAPLRWLRFLDDKPRLAVLRNSVEAFRLAAGDGVLNPATAGLFCTHLVSTDAPSITELKYRSLERAANELENLASAKLEHDEYLLALRGAESYVDWRSASAVLSELEPSDEGAIVHLEIGLGRFDRDDAVATIPEQEDFLSAFFQGAPRGCRVSFVLRTKEDPANGAISAHFAMRFIGPNTDQTREYFARLAPIARSVFIRGWSLYTPETLDFEGVCAEILPSTTGEFSDVHEDMGLLVDALASSGGGVALEMTAMAEEKPTSEGQPKVQLGVRLITPAENLPLANLVGSTIFPEGWTLSAARLAGSPETRSVQLRSALKVLHPPDGLISGRGTSRQSSLELPATSEVDFIGAGALIGRTTIQHPAADKTIDVLIPDESRAVHTYVLGRTGSGKTNTLKNIVRHDLQMESSVVVIDPHGDLFEYALRHTVGRREFVSLDFSADEIPSVNPIYLDATDEAAVLRNIDELVEAMIRSSYHQNAGPRFRDIARLCLETLVAVADEENGEFASLTDVPQLIEDLAWRNQLIALLPRLGRSDLSRRWAAHHRMKTEEQAEVEQWFVSKFSDFRRSAKFKAAVSGRPDVSIDKSLAEHLAVLIRVPTIGMGLGASRFLGSLIVERVLRYTMESGFNELSDPASLVVDEFQTFVGTSFLQLIPEARKFNLAVTIANQTLSQLTAFSEYEGSRSSEMERVILGNVGNLIVQSIAHADAERLSQEFEVPSQDVMRIGKHSAIVALTIRGIRTAAFTVSLFDSDQRPGLVSESSLRSEISGSVARASARVSVPLIDHTGRTLPGFQPPDSGKISGAIVRHPLRGSTFLEQWKETAQKVRERIESEPNDKSLSKESNNGDDDKTN